MTEVVDDTADVVGTAEDELDVDDPFGKPEELAAAEDDEELFTDPGEV